MKEPLAMNSQVLLPAPQRGGDSTQAVLLVRMQTQRRHTLNGLAAPERDVTTHLAQQPLDSLHSHKYPGTPTVCQAPPQRRTTHTQLLPRQGQEPADLGQRPYLPPGRAWTRFLLP